MKLKICELNPNPFKKEINAGELDEETVQKLMANMDELGLMGSLPVFVKNKKYFLINGHHRLEALKRKFGNVFQVEVVVHNYSEDQVLRGMIVENLTQRSNEFREELDNLLAIRKYLKETRQSLSDQRRDGNGKFAEGLCCGSSSDIANWLDKNSGDVMKLTKIKDTIRIADNLDEELIENIKKQSHAVGKKDEDDETIGVKVATALASFVDKQEQKDLAKAIKQSREQHGNRVTENLTVYKNAPDDIKQQVRQLHLDLADVEDAITISSPKDIESTTIFIPNFSSQIKQFNTDVARLEQQVALFSNVFMDKQFKIKYNNLKLKQKETLDNVITNIKKRIKKCYDKIQFFEDKLLNEKNSVEVA